MRKNTAVLMTAVMILSGIVTVPAVASSATSQLQANEAETARIQSEINAQEQEKNARQQSKAQLEGYLGEVNQQLEQLSTQLNDIEDQIRTHENSVTTIQSDLEMAQQDESVQYENMKKRIKYLYESGDMTLSTALLESGSISELLSKAEYVSSVSKYDRDMLAHLKETKEQIAQNQAALGQAQTDLAAAQEQLSAKKAEMEKVVAETNGKIQGDQAAIAKCDEQLKVYQEQLAREQEEREKLLAQQDAENSQIAQTANDAMDVAVGLNQKLTDMGLPAADVSSQSAVVSGTANIPGSPEAGYTRPPYAYTDSDLVLMATIIYTEAGIEPFEGKCAVGACVMNRVRSNQFPNTVLGVIYDPGQFTPIRNGSFARALASGEVTQDCYTAARMAFDGYNNIGDYLYFRTPNGRVSGLQIGGHIFHDGHIF